MSSDSRFYDKFSKIYDLVSTKSYYSKAREAAIEALSLKEKNRALSVACGTGQNFQFFEKNLLGTGLVVGVDLSKGMLSQAQLKIDKNNWKNIKLIESDAANLTHEVIKVAISDDSIGPFDSAICELGLTAIPNWEKVIDNMIALVKPGGRVVVLDWYMERLSLRGRLINCIGDADITRPTWKYLKERVDGFYLSSNFNRGGVFVAYGFVNGNTDNEYESSVR